MKFNCETLRNSTETLVGGDGLAYFQKFRGPAADPSNVDANNGPTLAPEEQIIYSVIFNISVRFFIIRRTEIQLLKTQDNFQVQDSSASDQDFVTV